MLVWVAAGVGWSGCVGLERSTLGVIVRGGGGGVVGRGRLAASRSIDAPVVSVVLAGLQSEVVLLLAAVRVVLVLRGGLRPVNISRSGGGRGGPWR